ncbi:very short patch repair endonuclease [Mycolicibacterium sp.]|uniref:very short patch repair endonuclease n=1 Tax=Mycolicibacterium sp. TaxID=2320850 RepID=UPI003D0CFAA2
MPSGGAKRSIPAASSEEIRRRMATTKRRDTGPELALRSALHRMGLRFFVDRSVLGSRRRVDIVFPTERVAVFVDGCFWHACPQHGTTPRRNRDWWVAKLAANRARDADTDATLRAGGWTVLRFYEHTDAAEAAAAVAEAVRRLRNAVAEKPR